MCAPLKWGCNMKSNSSSSPFLSPFHCSGEYHLLKYGGLTLAVYNLMYRVAKKSGKFMGSAPSIARYFGVNERSVDRALDNLEEMGFIILLKSGQATFESNVYKVLSHAEWALAHPDHCAQKESFPWTGEGDPLGQRLYVLSGCRIRLREFQVRNYRKTGLSEDRIAAEWERFLEQNANQPKRWRKSAGFHFWEYLKVGTQSIKIKTQTVESQGIPAHA